MPAGSPPKYKSSQDMQKKIEEYFKSCEGTLLTNDDGEYVYDKYGQPIFINRKPPTVTGLALSLGFTSRQALLNYQAKEGFIDTVTRAKSLVEEYAESRLFDKDGANGAKFSLANNFKGWAEKIEQKTDNTNKNIELTLDEARQILTDAGIDPDTLFK